MILLISFISSFEINVVNPFPALTPPFPITFPRNLFIAFEAKLLANQGKSLGGMKSINLAGVLQEAGDADSRVCTRS